MLSNDFDVPPDLEPAREQSTAPAGRPEAGGETAPPLVAIEYRNRGIPYLFLIPLQVLLIGFVIGYVRRLQPLPAHPRTNVVPSREIGAAARHENALAVAAPTDGAGGPPKIGAAARHENALSVAIPTGGASAPSGQTSALSASQMEATFPEVETPASPTALPASAFALSAPEGSGREGDARAGGPVATRPTTASVTPSPDPAPSVPSLNREGSPLPKPEDAPAGTPFDSPAQSPSQPPAPPEIVPQAQPLPAAVSEASPPPAMSAEEIEREILREAERREAEQDLMLQAKEEAVRKKRLETAREAYERRLAFHRELGAILRAGGATAGKQIETLCEQYGREVTPDQQTAVKHRLRSLPRPTTHDRVRLFRACGIPEPVILEELARDQGRKFLNARGGIRTADEARVRAAEQLVSFPPPPANRPRLPDAR